MAIQTMFCLRIIKPSLRGFRSNPFMRYADAFVATQHDEQLDAFFAAVAERSDVTSGDRLHALFDVSCALTTQGHLVW